MEVGRRRGTRYPRQVTVNLTSASHERLRGVSQRHGLAMAVLAREALEYGLDRLVKRYGRIAAERGEA